MRVNRVANQFVRSRSLLQFLFEIPQSRGVRHLIRVPVEISRIAKGSVAAGLEPTEIVTG
jgi:hypothetical protein